MAVIGIDLGGTKIIGALFDEEGTIRCQVSRLLEKRGGREVEQLVLDTIDKLIEQPGHAEDTTRAVGICVPGIADSKTGLTWAPNISGWDNYPLQKEVEQHLGSRQIEVAIASDRTCYILGEKWKGAAQDASNAIFISVGTGIGVGLLIDGNIVHGHGDIVGAAGWFGMVTPYSEEYRRYGCFESHASGDGSPVRQKRYWKMDDCFKIACCTGSSGKASRAGVSLKRFTRRTRLPCLLSGKRSICGRSLPRTWSAC